ncbi:hypothetical protein [Butyrivibrio sp. NC2002]|uniref:hypothetical protein n=1 Tax=Butyrivibrio sp. NC2002 TaxID=1410610 RepID=UPI000566C27D|nr:hypothetical protein [Butyrivibrio sp. NC2002]
MARKIYTYDNREKLYECGFWKELETIPQIVVSNDMKRCLKGKDKRGKMQGIFKNNKSFNVASFDDFKKIILSDWNDPENRYTMYVLASKYIKQLVSESENEERRQWLLGCRKNIGEMIESIETLEEADLTPENLDMCLDDKLELLRDVWNYLIENDETILKFKRKMEVLSRAEYMQKILSALFAIPETVKIDKVVYHGFFYITPIQERIMMIMEKCGIELIFLLPYDSRYPFAHEIWRETYSESVYPSYSEWVCETTCKTDVNGELFEGRKVELNNNIQIIEYNTLFDFVNGIRKSRGVGSGIYSANNAGANDIIRAFYPEEYGKRKLLAYPIGRFIWCINDMYDEEHNEIVLSEKNLMECFSSGWLSHNGKNGKNYMEDLVNVLPFFIDCESAASWEERIEILREIHEQCIPNITNENQTIERWQKLMGNPLGSYSQFSVPVDRVKIVIDLIKHLLSIATFLFSENSEIELVEHINRLKTIISINELSGDIYDEEREIASRILIKIQNDTRSQVRCFPEDAARALELYLDAVFDDGEVVNEAGDVVFPMYHTMTADYLYGKAHVCLCDNDSMPGGKAGFPWPLDIKLIEKLYTATGNRLLKNMMDVKRNLPLANRYFMYSALKCKEVILSWYSDPNGKEVSPSPYIGLIRSANGVTEWNPKRIKVKDYAVVSPAYVAQPVSKYKTEDLRQEVPKEAKMDFAVCPLRYLYGYLLNDRPVFQSEFVQKRSIYSLVVAISNLPGVKGIGLDEIYRNVSGLFPGMRESDKKEIYKSLTERKPFEDNDITGMDFEGDLYFTEERLRVHFPDWKSLKNAIQEYGKIGTKEGEKEISFKKPSASYISEGRMSKSHPCSYCPNIEWCKHSLYPRDKEKIYGKA